MKGAIRSKGILETWSIIALVIATVYYILGDSEYAEPFRDTTLLTASHSLCEDRNIFFLMNNVSEIYFFSKK
jgi:hypothetical protein